MTHTAEEIKALAIERYGNDIHLYAAQREGFINGYTKALEQVKSEEQVIIDTVNLMCVESLSPELRLFIYSA